MLYHRRLDFEADGSPLVGHYFCSQRFAGLRPGIVVFDEATGLSSHAIDAAERLARLGFAALAADYCERGEPTGDRIAEWLVYLSSSPRAMRARGIAALTALMDQPEVNVFSVAAMGYCLGGTIALELARTGAPLLATIGFHCGLRTRQPAKAGRLHGRVLIALGTSDPFVSAADRAAFAAEMAAAHADCTMTFFGGVGHSFTNPAVNAHPRDGVAYSRPAADEAWDAACGLLAGCVPRAMDAEHQVCS
jgi:dienelactone hydrolase